MWHLSSICRGKQTCRGKQKRDNPPRNQVKSKEKEITDSIDHFEGLNQVLSDLRGPILEVVDLETQPLQMELDTGAAVSLVSEQTYRMMLPDTP